MGRFWDGPTTRGVECSVECCGSEGSLDLVSHGRMRVKLVHWHEQTGCPLVFPTSSIIFLDRDPFIISIVLNSRLSAFNDNVVSWNQKSQSQCIHPSSQSHSSIQLHRILRSRSSTLQQPCISFTATLTLIMSLVHI